MDRRRQLEQRRRDVEKRRKKRFKEWVAKAKAYMKQSDWYEARKATDRAKVCADKSNKSEVKQVTALYDALEAQGQEQLATANEAMEGKEYARAITGYRAVVRTFGTLPCVKAARHGLLQLKSNPDAVRFFDEAKAEDADARIDKLIRGKTLGSKKTPSPDDDPNVQEISRVDKIKALSVAEQAKAVKQLRTIVKLYPKTKVGQRVAGELASLEADEKFYKTLSKHISETRAQKLYNFANMCRESRMNEKACAYYEEVLQKYPDSACAPKAKAMLAELKAKSGV